MSVVVSKSSNFFKSNVGLLSLIAAQLCISISIVVNKYLVQHSSMLLILTLRFVLGSLFLIGYVQYREKSLNFKQMYYNLSARDKFSLVVQGLFGGFLFNVLMLSGLKFTSATMAGIIASIVPVFIVVFSYFILKERVTKNELISIAIAVTGIIFINLSKVSVAGISFNLIGDILVLMALFPEALYTIVAKWHPVDMCPIQQSMLVNIVNSFAFCATLLMFPSDIITITSITGFDWFLIISVLSMAGFMFFIFWNIGLGKASTQQAGIVTSVVPVGACILAVIFLHEHIHFYELVGIFMVILAIYVGTKKNSTENSTENSIEKSAYKLIEPKSEAAKEIESRSGQRAKISALLDESEQAAANG